MSASTPSRRVWTGHALLQTARDEEMGELAPFMTGPREFGDVTTL